MLTVDEASGNTGVSRVVDYEPANVDRRRIGIAGIGTNGPGGEALDLRAEFIAIRRIGSIENLVVEACADNICDTKVYDRLSDIDIDIVDSKGEARNEPRTDNHAKRITISLFVL